MVFVQSSWSFDIKWHLKTRQILFLGPLSYLFTVRPTSIPTFCKTPITRTGCRWSLEILQQSSKHNEVDHGRYQQHNALNLWNVFCYDVPVSVWIQADLFNHSGITIFINFLQDSFKYQARIWLTSTFYLLSLDPSGHIKYLYSVRLFTRDVLAEWTRLDQYLYRTHRNTVEGIVFNWLDRYNAR